MAIRLAEAPLASRRVITGQSTAFPGTFSFAPSNCHACLPHRASAKSHSLRAAATAAVASARDVLIPIPEQDASASCGADTLPQSLDKLTVQDEARDARVSQGLFQAADDANVAADISANEQTEAAELGARQTSAGQPGILLPVGAEFDSPWVAHRQRHTMALAGSAPQFPGISELPVRPVGSGGSSSAGGAMEVERGAAAQLRRNRMSLRDRVAYEKQRSKGQGEGSKDRKHTAVARALTFCLRGVESTADVALTVQGMEPLLSMGAVTSCLSKLGQEGHTQAVLALLQWMREQRDSSAGGEDSVRPVSSSAPALLLVPNVFTYNAALGALRANREWGAMDRVLAWMQHDKVPLDAVTLNTYLAAYLDRGMDDVAWGVLAKTAEHLHPQCDLFSVRTMAQAAVLRQRREARGEWKYYTDEEDLSLLWGRLALLLDLYREASFQAKDSSPVRPAAAAERVSSSTVSDDAEENREERRKKIPQKVSARQQQQLPEVEARLRRACTEALREAVMLVQQQQRRRHRTQNLPERSDSSQGQVHPAQALLAEAGTHAASLAEETAAEQALITQGQEHLDGTVLPERIWAKRALELTERMRGADVRLDGSAYYWAIKCLCQDAHMQQRQIRILHREMRDRRYLPDVALCNAIISALGQARRWWASLEVLEEMRRSGPHPGTETEALVRSQFNFLLDAGRKRRLWKWSLQLLRRMQGAGVVPDAVSWRTALVTCARANETGAAVRVFREMLDAGHQADLVAYGALLSALEKGAQWQQADEVWQHMQNVAGGANLQAYTTMIAALGKQGQYGRAVALFQEMKAQGIAADAPAYNALISACACAGDGERAVEWLRKMEAAGVSPNKTSVNQAALALRNQGSGEAVWSMLAEWTERKSHSYDEVSKDLQVFAELDD